MLEYAADPICWARSSAGSGEAGETLLTLAPILWSEAFSGVVETTGAMSANCFDRLLWPPRLTPGELLCCLSKEGDFLADCGSDGLSTGGDCDADGCL